MEQKLRIGKPNVSILGEPEFTKKLIEKTITSVKKSDIAGLTKIGRYAFKDCSSLTSIEIPSSVTSIESYAFEGCYRLVEVINKSSLSITAGSSYNGYIGYFAKQIITDESDSKLSTDANGFIIYNDETDILLVNYIGNITEIVIPNNVTKINGYAFYNCASLTSIIIPDIIKDIGSSAFSGCSSLTSITIPEGVTSIGSSAFSGCSSLTSIEIPNGVTIIDSLAFNNCSSLTSIEIPSSVTSINFRTFYNCSKLTSINYSGTMAEWKSIDLSSSWKENSAIKSVVCSDGTITL